MAEVPSQIANWLYNVIQPEYVFKQVTYTHLYQFLQTHYSKNLRFKIRTSVYTSSSSGRSALLINLYGSIPTVNGSVPVRIWIPLHYPFTRDNEDDTGVPIVYVLPDPSNGLYLKPNNYVDSSGRFYHPYLTSWHKDCQPNDPLSRVYNLLELSKVLQESFNKFCPMSQGSIPPKPSKIPLEATQNQFQNLSISSALNSSSTLENEQSPPPLPSKPYKINPGESKTVPQESKIPAKYQRPLPLPPQRQPSQEHSFPQQIHSTYQISQPADYQPHVKPSSQKHMTPETLSSQHSNGSPSQVNYNETFRYEDIQKPSQMNELSPNKKSIDVMHQMRHKEANTPPSEIDLIDQADEPLKQQDIPEKTKSLMVTAIKSQLATEQSVLNNVNEERMKISALHSQLSHHLTQANANSENLNYHIKYLNQQKTAIMTNNLELSQLEEKNSKNDCELHMSLSSAIKLDDIVTPDSALVNQLYEVVADIKSIRDTINLVGGSYKTEGELINDDNIDVVVKSIRSLSRELFWLELTKIEIAKVMQL